MSANSNENSLSITAVALALALTAGLFWPDRSYQSFRPSKQAHSDHLLPGIEQIPARLWQDPLDAIKVYEDRVRAAAAGSESLKDKYPFLDELLSELSSQNSRGEASGQGARSEVEGTSSTPAEEPGSGEATGATPPDAVVPASLRGSSWQVLAVLVDGDEHAEAREERLRTRYALVAGLGIEGYYPWNTEAVGVMPIEIDGVEVPTPFERYSHDSKEQNVFVLWVDRRSAGAQPVNHIRQLVDQAFPAKHEELLRTDWFNTTPLGLWPIWSAAWRGSPLSSVTIIGPFNSNGLLDVVLGTEEVDHRSGSLKWRMLNARATVPEPLLLDRARAAAGKGRQAPSQLSEASSVAELLRHRGIEYFPVIQSDDQLLAAIAHELDLRGVDLGQTKGLALVLELDTLYAKSMSESFEAVLWAANHPESDSRIGQQMESVESRADAILGGGWLPRSTAGGIRTLYYLRGMDGEVPRVQGEERSPESPSGARRGASVETYRQPIGNSQLDYIRRQGASLAKASQDISVIGIMGSDVYDKQLILQALRPRFPDALFFTTDMDARLVHDSQTDWARNLIVASAYGLELSPQWQQGIPPFRSSYQTSTFLAARLATDLWEKDQVLTEWDPLQAPDSLHLPSPRVFEVSDHGAWELGNSKPNETLPPSVLLGMSEPAFAESFHPASPAADQSGPWRRFPLLLAVLLVVWLVSGTTMGRVMGFYRSLDADDERRMIRPFFLLAMTASGMLLLVWIWISFTWPLEKEGEPFAIFEGVSVWPTQVARSGAIVIAFWALLLGAVQMRQNALVIESEFGLETRTPRGWKGREGLRRMLRERALWSMGVEIPQVSKRGVPRPGKDPLAADLWSRYRRNAEPLWVAIRIAIMLALYGAFVALVFMTLELPSPPVRGVVSRRVDVTLSVVSVLAFAVLTFYSLDATRECASLIRRISGRRTRWPAGSKKVRRLGVAGEELDDILDIRLIAMRTKSVGKLIYPPAIVLLILLVAHNRHFDNWHWTPSILLLLGTQAALTLGAAVRMRKLAEKARRVALRNLRDLQCRLVGEGENERVEQLRFSIDFIRDLREGAFAHWFHSPALQAALLPAGGAGLLAFIDLIVQPGMS